MTTPFASEAFFHRLLGKALAAGASDVFLKVGQPPGARVRGDLVFFKGERIVSEDTRAAAKIMLGSDARIEKAHDFVAAYQASGVGRFRVSLFRHAGALSIVMRALPAEVPKLSDLGVPAAVTALSEKRSGLVVISGGAGQGKTTTVAAMVGHVNASHPRHIVTIEDPIEIEHEDARGCVSQREIGADVASFAAGIRAAERHDPDVIALSDLPDPEAFGAALEAAEIGRLVLAIVPAPDAVRALYRLFELSRGLYDASGRLADATLGVVVQRLVPKPDGSGRALACQLLAMTPELRDAIRRDDDAALRALSPPRP